MDATRHIPQLDAAGREALATWLGDTPTTVIGVHALRSGRCRAWTLGDPGDPDATLVEWWDLPGEPEGHGDPGGIWRILREADGWSSVLVQATTAPALAELIERDTGRPTRLYQDVTYLLDTPVPEIPHPAVRLLGPRDLSLLERAPKQLAVGGGVRARLLLETGVVACAIEEGEVVSIASCLARTERYGDIGVQTLESHRGGGLATAGAALVCRELQAAGATPTWGTGEDNLASQRVAQKLGFRETERSTYVIPQT